MTYRFDGYNYIVRLAKGDLLIESLTTLAKSQAIKGAFISGLGGVQWAELGFYDLAKKQYIWHKLDQLLEVTALQGTLAWVDDKPAIHIHGTFSNSDFQAFGGHVKELCVGGTLEIFLHTVFGDKQLTRQPNDEVGLALLDI